MFHINLNLSKNDKHKNLFIKKDYHQQKLFLNIWLIFWLTKLLTDWFLTGKHQFIERGIAYWQKWNNLHETWYYFYVKCCNRFCNPKPHQFGWNSNFSRYLDFTWSVNHFNKEDAKWRSSKPSVWKLRHHHKANFWSNHHNSEPTF